MEAVPRLPMISFDVKTSTEVVSFSTKLKQYIANFYHEDPESYNNEIHSLETLRAAAVRPSVDVSASQMLKKYYCQLHFLKSRFPMEDNQACAVYFSWRDNYSNMVCSVADIDFELMNILFDIGAIHSKLGAEDSRVNHDGMKMACTHFQCAAWAFQTVREVYPQMVSLVLASEVIHFMHLTCLAQAQECILEKSMMDNRKASTIAKVVVQVVDYYKQALNTLQTTGEDGSLSDLLGSRTYKDWIKYLNFKIVYHKAIALLYQGEQAEEQQKMGERVAFYQASSDKMQEAYKRASNLANQQQISEALAFATDVIEGKKKAAKNENEFIYHEEVPDMDALQEVKGASLVKGIAFSVNDVDVSGPDIFARLIPMEAHEASSLYSEQKANMLRQLGEAVENKDKALVEFMSVLQLEGLSQMRQANGLTDDVVDRAAAMTVKPTAIQDLVSVMAKLSNIYHDVEAMLSEIDALLKEEEEKEKDYQSQMGNRPPSIIATDLTREYAKYQEAHSKASDSNQNLHKAMTTYSANLKILSLPLAQIKQQIPAIEFPNPNINEEIIAEMETLLAKVDEMKKQRAMLWAQFHDAVKNDDITNRVITCSPQLTKEQLFEQELQKHRSQAALIEQNMSAQGNILDALVDAYARFTETRRYIQDVLSKRATMLKALNTCFDTYDDLLAKANKGLEFYNKLETNVSKLLQRIKSTCKVQDEEREQILAKQNKTVIPSSAPKLKDFLDAQVKDYPDQKKIDALPSGVLESAYSTVAASGVVTNIPDPTWPPAIRPAPLGSEMKNEPMPSYGNEQNYYSVYGQSTNLPQSGYNTAYATAATTLSNTTTTFSNNPTSAYDNKYYEENLNARMAALMSHKLAPVENQDYNKQNVNQPQYGYTTANPPVLPTQNVYNPNSQGNINPTYVPTENTTLNTDQYSYQTANYMYDASRTPSCVAQGYSDITQNYTNSDLPNTSLYRYYNQTPSNYTQTSYTQPTVTSTYLQTNTNNYTDSVQTNTQTDGNFASQYSAQFKPFTDVNNMYVQPGVMLNNYGGGQNAYIIPPMSSVLNDYIATNVISHSHSSNYSTQPSGTTYTNSNSTTPNVSTYATVTYGDQGEYQQYNAHIATTVPSVQYNTGVSSYYPYSNQAIEGNQSSVSYPNSMPVVPPISNMDVSTAYATYDNTTASYQNSPVSIQQTQPPPTQEVSVQPKKEASNVDLLSGLDFTINQAPLVPQPNKIENTMKDTSFSKVVEQPPTNAVKSNNKVEEKRNALKVQKKQVQRNSFQDPELIKQFTQEVDKFEKFVDILSTKTLSGPTSLELKWKEIQDRQEVEQTRKSISVARCYPMKNRFPDILPYDQTRVKLLSKKDDYINASYIKNITPHSPEFIVTQSPLQSTYNDFWIMVCDEDVELILCLLNDNEIGNDKYWPTSKPMSIGNFLISVENTNVQQHWTETLLVVDQLDIRRSRKVRHIQFTGWTSSLFPTSAVVVNFLNEILNDPKIYIKPIVLHCFAGIGRSGLLCLLLCASTEVLINPASLPDLPSLAIKLSTVRKNIVRDREHFKLAYQVFLHFLKGICLKHTTKKVLLDDSSVNTIQSTSSVNNSADDPLSLLDPLWASRKKT